MSIFTRELTWPSWKFGVLKISMIAFGIVIGSTFHEIWQPWHLVLWSVFGVTALLSSLWGIRALLDADSHIGSAD